MAEPKLVAFVSSVEGHLVQRPGSNREFFGAKLQHFEARAAGAAPIVWDTDQVVGLTDVFMAQNGRDIAAAIRSGALKKRTAEDFAEWLKLEIKRDDAEQAKLAEAKKQAAVPREAKGAVPATEDPK